ncbi:hypothetical protein CTI14_70190, partial [Methylobacterium radiotolerans]
SPARRPRRSTGTSSRIQFTPDLLPGDVTGITVYRPEGGHVRVRPRVAPDGQRGPAAVSSSRPTSFRVT